MEATAEDEHLPGGLSVMKSAIFIVAQMAGSGILALPNAFAGTGWSGFMIVTAICLIALYCGIILGKCWNLLCRHHSFEGHVRDPFPLIGYYAADKTGKYIVEACIMLTLFATTIVYLLLSSQQIESLVTYKLHWFHDENRAWIFICGGVLIPLTWFASPKEMPVAGYAASLCTIVACVLIVVRMGMKLSRDGFVAESDLPEVTGESFFKGFGTFTFAFGGTILIPTIQADMMEPRKISYAALQGFMFVYVLYLPIAVLPYVGIKGKIKPDILDTLLEISRSDKEGKMLIQIAQTLMTFHLLFATIIIMNPVSQQIEEHFGIVHRFGWKRIVIRTSLMLSSMGLAQAYPHFDTILNIMGASTVNMTCFILPALFYLQLQESGLVPLHQKVFHVEIIVVATLFGCYSMYSSIKAAATPSK